MNPLFSRLSTGLLALLIVITGIGPVGSASPAEAASLSVPVGVYTALQEDEDRYDDQSNRYRYPSSLRRKIDKLDDDEVEHMPIPVALGVAVRNLSPNFGDPRDGGARSHEGLDIMAPKGTPIASPTEAVVIRTGKGSGSGTYVTTANPGGEVFNYYHLNDIADGIRTGTELEVGDVLGYVGNTGNAAGGPTHLHFEIRDGRRATDPFPRLTKEFSNEVRIAILTDILKDLQAQLKRLLD